MGDTLLSKEVLPMPWIGVTVRETKKCRFCQTISFDFETAWMNAMRNVKDRQTLSRRCRQIIIGLATGSVVMLVIAIFAILQWQRAEQQSKIALSYQLAAQAQNALLLEQSTQETAVLLAILSMRLHPSGEAAQTLQNDTLAYPKSHMTDNGHISTLAFSPDGKYVVSGSEKKIARVWEISTGNEIVTFSHDDSPITSLAFSPDSRYVVSGSNDQSWRQDNTARVWEVSTGNEIARMAHDFAVTSVDISFDGKYVLSGGYDRLARVWEVSTGREVVTLPHGDNIVTALAFSLDGQYVVSGTREDRSVRVWEVSTGKEIAHMTHDDYVSSVAFSPDGRYVVSGSERRDRSLRVWEVSTGKEISRMLHDYPVTSVAFSPDGKYVISGSHDLTARVWDAATGQELSRMRHKIFVRAVAFSPDSKYVLTGDYYEPVYMWKWRPEDLITDACSRVTRNLTRVEWQKYIGSALTYQVICPNFPIEPKPTLIPITIPTSYTTAAP